MESNHPRNERQNGRKLSRREALVDGAILTMLAASGGAAIYRLRDRYPELNRRLAERRSPNPVGEEHPDFEQVAWETDTAEEKAYEAFLLTLSLTFVKPEEILKAHRQVRNGVQNRVPPPELWENMRKPLALADEMRKRLDSPLKSINSAYRCPKYNQEVPGSAKQSFHTRNMALDLKFDCGATKAFEASKTLREEGFFKGGIGRYPTFVHVDSRGENATW